MMATVSARRQRLAGYARRRTPKPRVQRLSASSMECVCVTTTRISGRCWAMRSVPLLDLTVIITHRPCAFCCPMIFQMCNRVSGSSPLRRQQLYPVQGQRHRGTACGRGWLVEQDDLGRPNLRRHAGLERESGQRQRHRPRRWRSTGVASALRSASSKSCLTRGTENSSPRAPFRHHQSAVPNGSPSSSTFSAARCTHPTICDDGHDRMRA